MSIIRLLTTGGRDFQDRDKLYRILDAVQRKHAIEVLIEGEGGEADKLARAWATECGVPVVAVPVDHALDGPWPGAGPRRNTRMLAERPSHCVAFPTERSRGTWDMVRQFNACATRRAPAWVVK